MRQEWEQKQLAEVALITMGQSPDGDTYNTRGDGVPLINGPVEFSSGAFGETVRSKFTSKPTKLCKKGDLILCVRGSTTGRMNIAGFDACIGRGVAAIRAKQFQPWINYFIRMKQQEIFDLGTGATFPNVSSDMLNMIKIWMPPAREQERIVAILDEAFAGIDAAIANTEKNRANARELFDTYLNSALARQDDGWITAKLAALCHTDRIITYGVIKLGEEIPDGVPCLRTSNVRWLDIETDSVKRISPALSREYQRTILQGGEVLVNVRGTLGGVAVAGSEMAGWNVSREVAVVPADQSEIEPFYLAFWIARKASQQWLDGVQKGVAYTGINIEDLLELPVSMPDKEKQREMVRRLNELSESARSLEVNYKRKLEALSALKQSILRKAFAGELTANPEKALQEAAD